MDSSNRTKNLPENRLANLLRSIKMRTEEIKNRQYTGFDNTTPKVSETDAISSYDVVIPAGTGSGVITTVFQADNQTEPYGVLRFGIFAGDPSTIATESQFDISIQDTTFSTSPDGQLSWLSNVYSNDLSKDFYIKVYVLATDTGEVTVS